MLRGPASSSTPSIPEAMAIADASRKPAINWSISGCPIAIGNSRVTGSATLDGPHSTDWEYALDPCMPV